MAASTSSRGSGSGGATASSTPWRRPSPSHWSRSTSAASAAFSTRCSSAHAAAVGEEGRQLAGPVADHRHPERLQRLGGGRQVEDRLGPGRDHADRAAGQLAEVGGDVGARRARPRRPGTRWTPPMPPVAKSRMPTRAAMAAVAETVVPASRRAASSGARSRAPALAGRRPGSPAAPARPRRPRPRARRRARPMAAGTAPAARTAAAQRRAASRLSGGGSPWATTLVSSATTGPPRASASATSGAMRMSRSMCRL